MAKIDFNILVISLQKLFRICRHQDSDKVIQVQEDKEVTRKISNSKEMRQFVKRLLNLVQKDASKPAGAKGPKSQKKPSNQTKFV